MRKSIRNRITEIASFSQKHLLKKYCSEQILITWSVSAYYVLGTVLSAEDATFTLW